MATSILNNETENNKERIVQFFDEMNLIKSEKQQRVNTAMDMYQRIGRFFDEIMEDVLLGRFMFDHDRDYYLRELIELYFGVVENTDRDVLADTDVNVRAEFFAENVLNTTDSLVKSSDNDPEYQDYNNAVLHGLPIREELIPPYVLDMMSRDSYRAFEIAANETLWLGNYIRHKDLKDKGQLTHTWETMKDEKVRATHVAVDGQTVPIDEPFIVGGYEMRFPGDISGGAPPELIIMCRCVEI